MNSCLGFLDPQNVFYFSRKFVFFFIFVWLCLWNIIVNFLKFSKYTKVHIFFVLVPITKKVMSLTKWRSKLMSYLFFTNQVCILLNVFQPIVLRSLEKKVFKLISFMQKSHSVITILLILFWRVSLGKKYDCQCCLHTYIESRCVSTFISLVSLDCVTWQVNR